MNSDYVDESYDEGAPARQNEEFVLRTLNEFRLRRELEEFVETQTDFQLYNRDEHDVTSSFSINDDPDYTGQLPD